jgi:predicted nucleic acid-binding protein
VIVFLDACAVIYLIEAKEPFHSQAIAALRAAHERHPGARLGVSRLSVLECLVKPLRDGDRRLVADYREFFASHDLTLVEIGPAVIETALRIRARIGLRTPDAIQAACALAVPDGDCLFLTNDSGFKRLQGLSVLVLGDTAVM